jgi:exopolysaccharide biosynthesis polyprenyl glycosylphosphotransferase
MRITESALVVSTLAIVLTFFSWQLGADRSRSFVVLFAPVAFILLVISFFIAIAIACDLHRRWRVSKRIAVLGAGPEAEDLVHAISRRTDRVSVRGLILPENSVAFAACAVPVLGTTSQLAELINRESLDRIIVACDTLPEPEVEYCGRVTRRMGVTVSRPIRTFDDGMLVRYQKEYGLHWIDLHAAPFRRWEEVAKRAVDVLGSLAVITLLLPLFAVIACLVRLSSQGPVFYRSTRVGKGGRHFTFWKFRSMYVTGPDRRALLARNEKGGHIFKLKKDPRVTPVGRVLRRLSLDELPQLFNVLVGEMSLVGPRPLPAEDLDPDGLSKKFAQWAEQRSIVRPGITGLWQVRGRSDLPFNSMVELDLEYIRRWSFGLDLSILLETPRAVLQARGAY